MSVSPNHKGLSLIEVLIVVTLIATMMALSLPMLSSANAEARSEVCRQNLIDIGGAIVSYTQDTSHLPAINEFPPHHEGLSLPKLVSRRLQTPNVIFCPSDETDRSQLLGTSYRWTNTFNEREPDDLEQSLGQPLLSDREAFHYASAMPVNEIILSRDREGYLLSVPGSNQDLNSANNHPTEVRFPRGRNNEQRQKGDRDKRDRRWNRHDPDGDDDHSHSDDD